MTAGSTGANGIEHHGQALRVDSRDDAMTDAVMSGSWNSVLETPRLRALDLPDRAIHDLVLVVAYFNFVNRIASGLAVELEVP